MMDFCSLLFMSEFNEIFVMGFDTVNRPSSAWQNLVVCWKFWFKYLAGLSSFLFFDIVDVGIAKNSNDTEK